MPNNNFFMELEKDKNPSSAPTSMSSSVSHNHIWFRGVCTGCGKVGKGPGEMGGWGTW